MLTSICVLPLNCDITEHFPIFVLVFLQLHLCIFQNPSRKFKFHWTLTRRTVTLYEYLCTFMIISRSIILKIRNVLDKSCTENQNSFMFSNIFLKVVLFMRLCGRIPHSQTCHRWQYNTAHALCVLDSQGYKQTLIIGNTHCLSMATMIPWTPLNVT